MYVCGNKTQFQISESGQVVKHRYGIKHRYVAGKEAVIDLFKEQRHRS